MQRRGLYTIFRNCSDLYFDRINDNLGDLRFDDLRFTIEVCIVKQPLINRQVYDCMSNFNRKS